MSSILIKGARGSVSLVKSDTLFGIKRKAGSELVLSRGHEAPAPVIKGLGGFEVVSSENSDKSANVLLDEARASAEVEVGTHIYHVQGSNKAVVPNGTIIILFDIGVEEAVQNKILGSFALNIKERIDKRQVIAQVTPDSPNPIKVAAALLLDPDVKWAEPDLDAVPDHYEMPAPPPLVKGYMWHLQNNGIVPDAPEWKLKRGADARVVEAWQRLGNYGSTQVVLAVLDIGFDLDHPDLKGKIVKPFDFWNNNSDLLRGDPAYTHGTPCASVAIAPASGGSGSLLGAAPNAKFMPLSGTSYSLEGTRAMFDYVIRNGADIVSCSWGTVDPSFEPNNLKHAAISKAAREGRNGKGCIVCFAAGNEGQDYLNYYGQNSDVITVGACTSQDEHAEYSNMGPELTVVAPSNGWWPILAARASWDEGTIGEQGDFKYYMDGRSRGNKFQHFGGTSSATPLVAGICALMLSANPELTAAQVKQILMQTADKIGGSSEYDSRGFSRKFGYGRVNADRAVAECLRRRQGATVLPAPPPTKPSTPSTPSSGTSTNKAMNSGLFRFNVQKATSAGFGVQIGNFASYANVLTQVERLQKLFSQPVLVHINEFGGKTVYRVIVGAFSKSNDAANLLTTMRRAGVDGFVQDLSKLS